MLLVFLSDLSCLTSVCNLQKSKNRRRGGQKTLQICRARSGTIPPMWRVVNHTIRVLRWSVLHWRMQEWSLVYSLVEASVETTALNHLVCTLLIKCKTKLYTHNKCDFFFLAINYDMLKEEGFCKWFIHSAWVNFPLFFSIKAQTLREYNLFSLCVPDWIWYAVSGMFQ